jgi:uncharacterized protein YgiM (DUF1202 family)
MKTLFATVALVGGLVMLAGTASAQTAFQCQQYAQNYAEQQYPQGGGAVAGAIGGGILGGIIAGATGNNVGGGVGIGAAGGLVVGSVAWQNAKKQAYDQAYAQCLGQGQPVYAPAPPVYQPVGPFNGVIYNTSSLNVRQGPGTGYGVVGTLTPGVVFGVSGCQGGWCNVSFQVYGPYGAQNVSGWASQTYIRPVSG